MRQIILFIALAASVGAALWVHDKESEEADVVAVATPEATPVPSPESHEVPTLALDHLNHRTSDSSDANPFVPKSWFVPPPPPPPVPPPKPAAPPLPFQFMGQFEDTATGKWVIYLAKGEESFSVSPGDKFGDSYRFDGIEKGNLVISYLPLSIKQYLPLSMVSE